MSPICNPMNCRPPHSSCPWIIQAIILGWLTCPPPGDLSDPEIQPMSVKFPALARVFFTTSTTHKAPWYLKNGDSFTSSLPFYFFFSLIAVARNSNTKLSWSGKRDNLILFLILEKRLLGFYSVIHIICEFVINNHYYFEIYFFTSFDKSFISLYTNSKLSEREN